MMFFLSSHFVCPCRTAPCPPLLSGKYVSLPTWCEWQYNCSSTLWCDWQNFMPNRFMPDTSKLWTDSQILKPCGPGMTTLRSTLGYGTLAMLPILAMLLHNAVIHPWDPELILDPLIRNMSLCSGSLPLDTPEYSRRNVRIPLGPGTCLRAFSTSRNAPACVGVCIRIPATRSVVLSEIGGLC